MEKGKCAEMHKLQKSSEEVTKGIARKNGDWLRPSLAKLAIFQCSAGVCPHFFTPLRGQTLRSQSFDERNQAHNKENRWIVEDPVHIEAANKPDD
ncbi:MAG TPA: hypothetical protein VGY66_29520, partial [Gemmataceae bacterium]|nr:hypothetical protein [Gemmataceae bacterium]